MHPHRTPPQAGRRAAATSERTLLYCAVAATDARALQRWQRARSAEMHCIAAPTSHRVGLVACIGRTSTGSLLIFCIVPYHDP